MGDCTCESSGCQIDGKTPTCDVAFGDLTSLCFGLDLAGVCAALLMAGAHWVLSIARIMIMAAWTS